MKTSSMEQLARPSQSSAMTARLPGWAQKLLASCPNAGQGVNRWLFKAAVNLHQFFPDKNELFAVIEHATADCGRPVDGEEIWRAITNSENRPAGHRPPTPPKPQPNEAQIATIAANGPDLAGLEALSPVRFLDDQPHTEEIIDRLFPGNPLLCASTKKNGALTRPREQWRGFMDKQQFTVPSPMTSIRGKTQDGKPSMRCLANTGPRRFLVVEFDTGTFDEHAALLAHLYTYAPLVLAVHSGNKSLHGWFFCAGQPDAKVEKFFRYAVSLGADPATWTRCQYVRMPDGKRDNGVRQRVIYFDPKPVEFYE